MAKGPAVIGVLTEPPQPTWWKANRHKVLLVIGYWLGTHTADASPAQPHPRHTPPATHSPTSPGTHTPAPRSA